MSVLTAVAQPPDDPFDYPDKLTDDDPDAWTPIRPLFKGRQAVQNEIQNALRKNLAEVRRMLLMMEIDADYRRMYPPVCVPSRGHL
jgi:hypothetical protein